MLNPAVDKVISAINSTLLDDRGSWILSNEHTDARSEWAITAPVDGLVKRIVIDRTFIDKDGVRWIIDYKTGDHGGSDRDVFLDAEQARYAEQLQRYADIIGRMEQRPVKAALYFPLLKGWREFDPVQVASTRVASESTKLEGTAAKPKTTKRKTAEPKATKPDAAEPKGAEPALQSHAGEQKSAKDARPKGKVDSKDDDDSSTPHQAELF